MGDEFFILIERNKRQYILNYKVIGKRSYELVKTTDLRKKLFQTKTKKRAKKSKKTKKKSSLSKKRFSKSSKKKNILEKYKAYLQNAYVVSPVSFVYKDPDFDSEQLHHLKAGENIIVSKKVFTPSHRFGTFYKVFIKKPKKVVGYVSEIETVPEFVIYNNKPVKNVCYTKVKKQIKKTGSFIPSSLAEGEFSCRGGSKAISSYQDKKNRFVTTGPRYFGVSGSWLFDIFTGQQQPFVGLKLSGKRLLIPFLDTDINALFGFSESFNSWWSGDFKMYADLLFGYPLIGSDKFTMYALTGVGMEYFKKSYDWHMATSLSLRIPINNEFAFRTDAKLNFSIINQSLKPIIALSVQRTF